MLRSGIRRPGDLLNQLTASRPLRNVGWNLLGGVWTGALIVLATPWYLAQLGLDGYGILGLWLMMQVMMGLLDVGMGATLVKEFADPAQDGDGLAAKRDLLRTLEMVYWSLAALAALALAAAAGWLGAHWLQSQTLPQAQLAQAIRWMALALGLQFPAALYANGLAGLQEHRRMTALLSLGSTLRFGGGALVLLWRADLVWFFAAQVLAAALQTLATRRMVWGLISRAPGDRATFRLEIFRRLWRFSMGMALTAVAGVLLANADRMALSRLQPTAELGKYAVAFTATGLLQMGIQPFYRAFFPRYAELVAAGDAARLRETYFRSCRLMAAFIIPLGILGWVFAPQLFQAWLGQDDRTITEVFRWLLIGITCSGLMWLPAAFQQASGRPGLHAGMIAGALLLGAPVMLWAIRAYGTVGATTVWLLHGVSGLTLELWLMHRQLLMGELFNWYRTVLWRPLLASLPLVALSWWLLPGGLNRWLGLGWIAATGLAAVAASMLVNLGGGRTASASAFANLVDE